MNSTPSCQEEDVLASGRGWKVIAGHVYHVKENVGFAQR